MFFQLVELFQRLDKQFERRYQTVVRSGGYGSTTYEDAIDNREKILRNYRNTLLNSVLPVDFLKQPKKKLITLVEQSYANFYMHYEDKLGPLFRTLYHMFRLIDRSGLDELDKVAYANIARGLLGKDFLLLLMLNSFSEHGKGFKPYIEIYGLLKHISIGQGTQGFDERLAEIGFNPCARMSHIDRKAYWEKHPRPKPAP